MSGADEGEMTVLESILLGDVADVDVRPSVTIQIAEINAHAFVRVAAKHFRLRRRERSSSFQQLEAGMTGCRNVVQEAVGAEVVGEIDFGEQVAVEVARRDCK